jgi:hypothetical protein
MKTAKLIINESYWYLFEDKQFKTQSFIVPEIEALRTRDISTAEYTRNLCLLLQDKDEDKLTKYGIEIKTNGSSRPSRIPLVRLNKHSQSIWKVCPSLKDVEKTATGLKDHVYYLNKSRIDKNLQLPSKVLFANFSESEYANNSEFSDFVKKQVQENDLVWITSDFVTSLFGTDKIFDLDSIVSKNKSIYTKVPLI